ncbi:MAG: 23S rRNA (adenine(2503)-C(2))-methyltransferase RlmN [Clostridiales bacterium]|nr:23S rRNA (adenine(2503)-C(2))-methyltransferase RlmN [Candidatus Apopatousia equi]
MEVLLDYSLAEMEDIVKNMGEQKFRASQIFNNLYLGKSFSEISNISGALKEKLTADYISQPCTILDKKVSQIDGTIKFLFKLHDNNIIESVLMKYKYGYTVCVSTQVGCRMGCKFCASTLGGLIRNLTAGEILGQVIQINKFLEGGLKQDRKITNIVLMGSGEPLDNYDNVAKFLRLVSSEGGLNISERNISLSTCGIVPNIYRLADDGFKITLTISLHAPNDEKRKQTMPIANKFRISQIVKACKYYFEKTGRRIMFEYVLVKGINNSKEDATELRHTLKGLPCHVNVICLNSVDERTLEGTTREEANNFVTMLVGLGLSSTLRRTMGQDIDGACGQLRRRYLENNKI